MNKRIVGIIIIIIALLILTGIVYFLFFYDFSSGNVVKEELVNEQNQTTDNLTPSSTSTTPTGNSLNNNVQPLSPPVRPEIKEDDLARMAAAFAERLGSYSNQSDYGNIQDLRIFMSDSMQVWADDFIREAGANNTNNTIYYGVVTRALSQEVLSYNDSGAQASILVKTQRRESFGASGNSTSNYEDIIINFIKERGAWKVNSAEWQG